MPSDEVESPPPDEIASTPSTLHRYLGKSNRSRQHRSPCPKISNPNRNQRRRSLKVSSLNRVQRCHSLPVNTLGQRKQKLK